MSSNFVRVSEWANFGCGQCAKYQHTVECHFTQNTIQCHRSTNWYFSVVPHGMLPLYVAHHDVYILIELLVGTYKQYIFAIISDLELELEDPATGGSSQAVRKNISIKLKPSPKSKPKAKRTSSRKLKIKKETQENLEGKY